MRPSQPDPTHRSAVWTDHERHPRCPADRLRAVPRIGAERDQPALPAPQPGLVVLERARRGSTWPRPTATGAAAGNPASRAPSNGPSRPACGAARSSSRVGSSPTSDLEGVLASKQAEAINGDAFPSAAMTAAYQSVVFQGFVRVRDLAPRPDSSRRSTSGMIDIRANPTNCRRQRQPGWSDWS